MLSHLSHSKASNRYRCVHTHTHTIRLKGSPEKQKKYKPPFGLDQKRFRFLTIAWSHIRTFSNMVGMGLDVGIGIGVDVCQKSVFYARAHFCQDIIPWDLFVYAIFFFNLLSLLLIFHFDFCFSFPFLYSHSEMCVGVFFYSCYPRGLLILLLFGQYPCVQWVGLCVCRQFQFQASNH